MHLQFDIVGHTGAGRLAQDIGTRPNGHGVQELLLRHGPKHGQWGELWMGGLEQPGKVGKVDIACKIRLLDMGTDGT